MPESPRFDTAEVFDEDYLHFYAGLLTDEVSDRQAQLLWQLLELDGGAAVLDLACGHGRIANRLAARGATVTGLDATPLFLERARREAEAQGLEVTYVEGDMRALPWRERFDAVVSVFTSFGYFDDAENRRVLEAVRAALRPGGRFCLETNNLAWLLANYRPEIVVERDGAWMIDRNAFDLLTGRSTTRRTVLRDGRERTFEFSVRMFTFTELRDWLLAAGFTDVTACSSGGEQLTRDTPRMVVVARA